MLPPRQLLLCLLLPALSAWSWAAGAPGQDQDPGGNGDRPRSRPNIVVILTDDQNPGDMGCAGHPWLQTPHMDALAEQGVRFRRAFVTTALCSPSRASLLTGRYARHHRILSNFEQLEPSVTSFATELQASGYATAYVGKWHMGTGGAARPGFDYTASYGGHGRVRDSPFMVGTKTTKRTPTQGWIDDVATDYAIDYLKSTRRRPVLLYLGFKAPHTPRQPDARHAELYANEELPEPPVARRLPPYPTRKEHDALVAAAKSKASTYVTPDDWLEHWEGERIPETELLGGSGQGEDLRNYYRLISGVDENIGRLMATLRELNIERNTIVVLASDNGLMNGRLGIYGKRSAYDEALAIPLIVRLPPAWEDAPRGLVNDALALNVDVAPTLLDLAGLTPPASMAGRSLRPLLFQDSGDPAPPWRDRFVAEFEPARKGAFPEILALRTAQWKLITYPGHPGWTELFNLLSDPFEEVDLAGDAEHQDQLAVLQELLAQDSADLGPPSSHKPSRGNFR